MIRSLSFAFLALVLVRCSSPMPVQDAGPTCPAQTGAGTTHDKTISADETWKAADGPHHVTNSVNIAAGATLTIEPCTIVKLKKDVALTMSGSLDARGTADKPIAFLAEDSTQPWSYVQVFGPGTIKLAYATLSNGGAADINGYAALEARGDQLMPTQPLLQVDHVAISNSASIGVSLRAGAAFTSDSKELVITGAKDQPVRMQPRLATNLPSGTYTGNGVDEVLVETDAYGEVNFEDVTFHDRGIPYRIGSASFGDFRVGPKTFKLTLEAGVKFMFKPGGKLQTDRDTTTTGTLVMTGTAAKPVVLTSGATTPAAGDWRGIVLSDVVASGTSLDHVEIRFAGGPSLANGSHCQENPTVTGEVSKNEDAALAIFHQPTKAYLTNSVVADSKGVGVDLAYHGDPIDFLPTNTFSNLASCKVTFPRPTVGQCPATVPCP